MILFYDSAYDLNAKPSSATCTIQWLYVFSLCNPSLFQGLTRTVQGPSLIDLKDQVKVDIKDFRPMFLIGTATFPLGNLIGNYAVT
jgi:hypothetical protein